MDQQLISRILWAVVIVSAILVAYQLGNRLLLSRAARQVQLPDEVGRGVPTLLYFTTPTCAPCKTVQRPAIERLKALAGDRLRVVEIDASTQPEMARQWGVLSVPTTFVLDAHGRPRHVNHGVTPTEKLLKEFETFEDFSI